MEGPEFECSGPQLEGPEFEYSELSLKHVNRLLNFAKPDRFSNGVAARLPEAYKKFWYEWKVRQPAAVHYIPEPGKWKRDPETGVVTPVQNTPIPLVHTKESHKGLWGGEAVIKGFQKRDPQRRRVPHFWFPALHRSVIYSEILNKHMSIIVTQRALDLIHKNYGLDHYILKVYEEVGCVSSDGSTRRADIIIIDRQKDKGVILDPTICFEIQEQQPQEYNAEEIDWYGLDFFEAIKKQMSIEESMNKPMPLKILYRAELVEKLQAAGIQGVKDALEEHEDSLQSRDNADETSPGSSTESYPAFARIGLRENPGKNLNQGSPLSPILYNIATNHILDELTEDNICKHYGKTLSPDLPPLTVLGFADDTPIIGKSREAAIELTRIAMQKFNEIGLEVNPRKCVGIRIEEGELIEEPLDLDVNCRIRVLKHGESIKYLGVTFNDFLNFDSKDRGAEQNPIKFLQDSDKLIRSALKQILQLPTDTPDRMIYSDMKCKGLGLFKAEWEAHLQHANTCRVLTLSANPYVTATRDLFTESTECVKSLQLTETSDVIKDPRTSLYDARCMRKNCEKRNSRSGLSYLRKVLA
ncbi:hypothetical protein ANN_02276 [Periplaneta americana]|uniref:Large ribosomal subunit protein bL28m n=1 Tax=Periplaneta americana TaxID=6978 RepID=A0ABQ8TYY4_PERAM|nr:hypothetical protein ANN_02276 [Periplaneta americana]